MQVTTFCIVLRFLYRDNGCFLFKGSCHVKTQRMLFLSSHLQNCAKHGEMRSFKMVGHAQDNRALSLARCHAVRDWAWNKQQWAWACCTDHWSCGGPDAAVASWWRRFGKGWGNWDELLNGRSTMKVWGTRTVLVPCSSWCSALMYLFAPHAPWFGDVPWAVVSVCIYF